MTRHRRGAPRRAWRSPGAAPAPRTRIIALVLAAVAAGAAWADTCAVVPGASEFTIADVGRVVFEELRTDRAADAVLFGGGVCLEVAGERITVRAERLDVRDLGTAPRVTGAAAEVRSGPWLLGAEALEATGERVRLERATLVGEGLVGLAERLDLLVADGVLRAERVSVATPSLRLDLRAARFDGVRLEGEDVVLSTCDCPPAQAGVRLEGRGVRYALASGVVELEHGTLLLETVPVPLPPLLTLSEALLADLRAPLTLSRDERRGWLLELVERSAEGGRVRADVALEDIEPPRARVYLSARDGPADVALVLTSGGADVRVGAAFELGREVELRLSQRFAGGLAERVQDAALRLSFGPDRALAAVPAGGFGTYAEGTAALSAQQFGRRTVATPRVGGLVRFDAASPAAALGVLRLRAEAGATGYAVMPGGQQWLDLTSRWDARFGLARVAASHAYRAVWGTSPFDDEVDAVAARHLSALQLALRPDGGVWRADVEVRYDWRPDATRPAPHRGLERLRADARWRFDGLAGTAVATTLTTTVDAAGWLDPRAERDAFARFGVDVAWPDSRVEVGIGVTFSLLRDAPGLRSLSVAGSAPLRPGGSSVEVRPYLALDVWPTLRGAGWPIVRGHGLGVLWESRYGTLDLAYRSEPDGSVTSSLAFRIEAREPRLEDLR